MNCPKCGYPRMKFVKSRRVEELKKREALRKRKAIPKGHKPRGSGGSMVKQTTPREDFRVKCSRCGYEGEES